MKYVNMKNTMAVCIKQSELGQEQRLSSKASQGGEWETEMFDLNGMGTRSQNTRVYSLFAEGLHGVLNCQLSVPSGRYE